MRYILTKMNRHFLSIHMDQFCGIFITLLLINCIQQINGQVNKCCPIDSVLRISDSINNHSLSCATNDTQVWDAYNILHRSDSNCVPDAVEIIEENKASIELNGCLDVDVNNRLVALSCSQNDHKSTVHLLNKCCPAGQSYDHSERFCIEDSNSHLYFQNLFGNSLVAFKNRTPSCSKDEVAVEYFSTEHNIQFVKNKLQVNGHVLSPNKFCIEDLINVDPNGELEIEDDRHIIVRSCRPRSVCKEIPCIQRCCKSDEVITPGPASERCQPHPDNKNLVPVFHDITEPLTDTQKEIHLKDYGVLHSWGCKQIYPLKPKDIDDTHYLHKNGKLYMIDEQPYDLEKYCLENILAPNGSTEIRTFLCYEDKEFKQPAKFDYYPYGLSISCIFLAATLIVYLSLPKLLNLHGKTLVCHVVSFLAAYITLACLQFNKQTRSAFCYEVAFFLLYCLIAAFCWQSVMCFDIWLTFGSLRSSFMMRHNTRNQRKFLLYSAYAWGVPLVWVIITLCAEKFKPLPRDWNPSIAESTCFFASHINWRDHFVFFLLPAGLHVIVNCILFIITAINCSKVKADIHRMQCASDETCASNKRNKFIMSKAIFTMNLKLFTVMGISWILEIISTFNTNKTIEVILDLYNIFLGVFIFFIFVFKRKVFFELKRRLGFKLMNAGSATPRSTTITHTANLSMRDFASEKNLPILISPPTPLQVQQHENLFHND